MAVREWPAGAGEISGIGMEKGGQFAVYEEGCRRMVIAGAAWLDDNGGDMEGVAWSENRPAVRGVRPSDMEVIMVWEKMMHPTNEKTVGLFRTLHEACCDGKGDQAGPSYNQMAKALEHVSYIAGRGWDAYVRMMESHAESRETDKKDNAIMDLGT